MTIGYRRNMARTGPFHAATDSTYHDNTECMFAAEIPPSSRQDGDGGKERCDLCRALNRAEERTRP